MLQPLAVSATDKGPLRRFMFSSDCPSSERSSDEFPFTEMKVSNRPKTTCTRERLERKASILFISHALACTHAPASTHMHARSHDARVSVYAHTRTRTHTHTHAHTRTHARTHTRTHTHTNKQTHTNKLWAPHTHSHKETEEKGWMVRDK